MSVTRHSPLARSAGLLFGAAAFVAGPAMFVYLAFFLGNLWPHEPPLVDPSVDVGETFSAPWAALNNVVLIVLFGLQHSLMARDRFKAALGKILPDELERSFYVAVSTLAMAATMVFWLPIPIVVYDLGDGVIEDLVWSVYVLGWLSMLTALVAIGPDDLLGFNQARAWFAGRSYAEPPLKANWLFARLRHPLYAALLVCLWVTPRMTVGHILFAAGYTLYIAIGMRYEERDLIRRFGKAYRDYRARTPALLPRLFG